MCKTRVTRIEFLSAKASKVLKLTSYNRPIITRFNYGFICLPAYNAREWESVDISQNSTNQQPRTLLQSGGARYIIRSESDLELAIPANERPRICCRCLPRKESQSATFEHYACIILAFVAMSAVYVALVIAILYSFK